MFRFVRPLYTYNRRIAVLSNIVQRANYAKKTKRDLFPPALPEDKQEEDAVMAAFRPASLTSLERVWHLIEREYLANERNVAEVQYESSMRKLKQCPASPPRASELVKCAVKSAIKLTELANTKPKEDEEEKPTEKIKTLTNRQITQRISRLLENTRNNGTDSNEDNKPNNPQYAKKKSAKTKSKK